MIRLLKNVICRISKRIQFQNQISGNVHFPKDSLIEASVLSGNIQLARKVIIHKALLNGDISIERFSSLWGPDTIISGKVKIGSFCSIASNCNIISYDHNHKRITTYFIQKNFFLEDNDQEISSKGPIIIGSDVWIGSNTVILGGVHIGHGAIVAAGAVVTKSVRPYSIVAGNPAREIGRRFDEDIISNLLKLEWWNWSDERIRLNKELFKNDLTPELLSKLQANLTQNGDKE